MSYACLTTEVNFLTSSMLTILLRSINLFFFLSCFYHTVCFDLASEATFIVLLQPFFNFHFFLITKRTCIADITVTHSTFPIVPSDPAAVSFAVWLHSYCSNSYTSSHNSCADCSPESCCISESPWQTHARHAVGRGL